MTMAEDSKPDPRRLLPVWAPRGQPVPSLWRPWESAGLSSPPLASRETAARPPKTVRRPSSRKRKGGAPLASPLLQQQHTWNYTGQNTFGSFLKKERARRRISRHSLAVVSGIQERRLEAIELNQSAPSYRDIASLATILNIPEQDLLEAAGCIKREEGA